MSINEILADIHRWQQAFDAAEDHLDRIEVCEWANELLDTAADLLEEIHNLSLIP